MNFKASETVLKESLKQERELNNHLNEKILELNRKLFESDLNDSIDSLILNKTYQFKIDLNSTNPNPIITSTDSFEGSNKVNFNSKIFFFFFFFDY